MLSHVHVFELMSEILQNLPHVIIIMLYYVFSVNVWHRMLHVLYIGVIVHIYVLNYYTPLVAEFIITRKVADIAYKHIDRTPNPSYIYVRVRVLFSPT